MTHAFVGVDIGSTMVRVLHMTGSPRNLVAERFIEEPIQAGLGPVEGLRAALDKVARQGGLKAEVLAITLAEAHTTSTRVKLPFNDPKVLHQVLPSQVASQLPLKDDDVIDFFIVGEETNAKGESMYDIVVVAYPAQALSQRLELVQSAASECDPHILVSLQYAEHRAASYLLSEQREGCYALIDIGASETQFTIMRDGRYEHSRVLLMGGRAITQCYAEAFNLGDQTAELAKLDYGFVVAPGQEHEFYRNAIESLDLKRQEPPPYDPALLADASRRGLRALIMGLRQSLTGYSLKSGVPVDCIYVAGGGGELRGLTAYMSSELGVACKSLQVHHPSLTSVLKLSDGSGSQILGALSMAIMASEHGRSGSPLNLRRGAFSYKGSFEFLRERALSLGLLTLMIFGAFVFMIYMQLHALDVERDQLRSALSQSSTALFGRELLDRSSIEKEMDGAAGFDFLPQITAYDHLVKFHQYLPLEEERPEDEPAALELTKLNIDTKLDVVALEGNITTEQGLVDFQKALERYPCFEAPIVPTKVQGGQSQGRVSFGFRIPAHLCDPQSEDD